MIQNFHVSHLIMSWNGKVHTWIMLLSQRSTPSLVSFPSQFAKNVLGNFYYCLSIQLIETIIQKINEKKFLHSKFSSDTLHNHIFIIYYTYMPTLLPTENHWSIEKFNFYIDHRKSPILYYCTQPVTGTSSGFATVNSLQSAKQCQCDLWIGCWARY